MVEGTPPTAMCCVKGPCGSDRKILLTVVVLASATKTHWPSPEITTSDGLPVGVNVLEGFEESKTGLVPLVVMTLTALVVVFTTYTSVCAPATLAPGPTRKNAAVRAATVRGPNLCVLVLVRFIRSAFARWGRRSRSRKSRYRAAGWV